MMELVFAPWRGGAITVEILGYRVRVGKPHLKLCIASGGSV